MDNQDRSYLIYGEEKKPRFVKEGQLCKSDCGELLGKLISIFNKSSEESRDVFLDFLEISVKDQKKFEVADLIKNDAIKAEIEKIFIEFSYSPLIVRDYFTRSALEKRNIIIPAPPSNAR